MAKSTAKQRSAVAKHYDQFEGQKVVLFCARYNYWGVLSEVIDDDVNSALVLANAVAVEQTGPANG